MLSHNDVTHCGTAKNPNLGEIKLIKKKAIMTLFEQYAGIEGVYRKIRKKGAVNMLGSYEDRK